MKKVVTMFEELIQGYYGGSSDIELRPLSSLDTVIANYYGRPPRKGKEKCNPAAQVTTSADDGEVLSHRKNGKCNEYVIQSSLGDPAAAGSEYVVQAREYCPGIPTKADIDATDQDIAAAAECRVEVLQSQQQSPAGSLCSVRPSARTFAVSSPPSHPQPKAEVLPPMKDKVSEDDFAADLKAILTGQSVYDPQKKKMVPRDQMERVATPASNDNGGRPSPESPNQHEIFDRIAKSMQYANQFDLGDVEVTKRLNDFDAVFDLKQKAKDRTSSRAMSPPATSAGTAKTGIGDFIHDLDAIRKQCSKAEPAMNVAVAAKDSRYSRPMFDTGEHALFASDLKIDVLRVGKDPGVSFSYGQIIAMADLYESVEQMMSTDTSELNKIKRLIQQSTDYYRIGKGKNVETDEWWEATNHRFLTLAASNYEHFSPNLLLGSFFVPAPTQHKNNKTKWEDLHRQAILEAQKAFAAAPNKSVLPDTALVINAFGDHYLTDAFAAGHSFNKDEMMAYFKSNFYDRDTLKVESQAFIAKLAQQAFNGDVKSVFSRLETVDEVPVLGRMRINTAEAFQSLLGITALQQPETVANIAVKAFHDKLNKEGLEVVNGVGNAWQITGDGFLNVDTLHIVQQAVSASANQIYNDPSIVASNLNFDLYFADVWKYVPQLTDASKRRVIDLAAEYLCPTTNLVNAAAAIITADVKTIAEELKRQQLLRDA